MLDIEEIKLEIARLEYEESSYPNYQKLANLYTILDRAEGRVPLDVGYSRAAAPTEEPVAQAATVVDVDGDSDFLRLAQGKDNTQAWYIMDELMDTLRAVNGKVYARVMDKLREL